MYLYPIKFRAPFIFAPLIFEYSYIRARVIFAHWQNFFFFYLFTENVLQDIAWNIPKYGLFWSVLSRIWTNSYPYFPTFVQNQRYIVSNQSLVSLKKFKSWFISSSSETFSKLLLSISDFELVVIMHKVYPENFSFYLFVIL